MTPHYADDWLTVYHGDARAVMAELPAESVHCVVTSPPYWGLRDYSQPGQLGLEPTPEAYVESMVAVFREVRRVLRSDGTVWLNLGDSYAAAGYSNHDNGAVGGLRRENGGSQTHRNQTGLKPKDLVGIPWRVAFALQADGWYLRSDIIWAKPNPMPESVTDRPTKAHEYLFLLSKSARYYYDADAVREADSGLNGGGFSRAYAEAQPSHGAMRLERPATVGRNLRSVWTIATAPYPGAHFATFPPKLVEPCIKAGTSERGVCPECGAPWVREVERETNHPTDRAYRYEHRADHPHKPGVARAPDHYAVQVTTTGWRPSCEHRVRYHADHSDPVHTIPATVLDPFAGSGTTGLVAQRLSRRAVLIDLSMDYLDQLMHRNREVPLGL